ncbi:hypothetical protein BDV95DRAFT_499130 [Massariosphaeria phaeospora]|uniref:BTB domain-containing protein n=1 Tax=Massariosphaeria phaeospora TaxID=100035 RepID=A0A7C8M5H0_9PLEO|nr:hypothetical protein BDV95DRAFT_499130 [Massariosphaeria phaeospora]
MYHPLTTLRSLTRRSASDPIIKLSVREEKTIVSVHKSILCASSKFFQSATKSEWTELRTEAEPIDLGDDELEVVKLYAHWVYVGKLPTWDNELDGNTVLTSLCKAYVFGEKIMDTKYKNMVIDGLSAATKKYNKYPLGAAEKIVYDGTPSGSPARRLLADFWAYRGHKVWFDHIETCPADLLKDALKAMMTLRPTMSEDPWEKRSQNYHEKDEV